MAVTLNSLSCNILAWHALAPGYNNQQQWQAWAQQPSLTLESGDIPKFDAIPMMMRRRMSLNSKMAVQAALTLCQDDACQVDSVIFTSRHGELGRTMETIVDLNQGEEASPMAFSQSVHNTAAGLFTIASKRKVPAISLASGNNSFAAGWVEACMYLKLNPTHRVLLVDFDQPLPDYFAQFQTTEHPGYAVALLLEAGNQISLSSQRLIEAGDTATCPMALSFLHGYLSEMTQWQQINQQQVWHWQQDA
ncbi:hypothetical protein VST7929_01848 [Vibrio stylophorae]|uniref:Beta-ketoacyl synthase-like N-terminal domain-containing protein n=1 Tax=Vibrio stylophorae TaxID=659351 RepID=A0ABN8DVD0_9VIBR|nr:beta-ketoacyl synthase chain length factor [Vibrio stylophorae]CAH0533966.1 hypothetical protein VST7929_01848 [Vibrio stylophorae]